MENKIIHCIGTSHVCFFAGKRVHKEYPKFIGTNHPFKTYRLGATLAYNLCSYHTTTRGREKLFGLLKHLPEKSNILLCYGEVDCRSHLVKQAAKQSRPLKEVVQECVDRYLGVVVEVKNLGFNVGVWGVTPSTNHDKDVYPRGHPFPCHGTLQERNMAAKIFNNYLKELSDRKNIIFVSIFEEIINEDCTPKEDYYIDAIHLSNKGFPLALDKIKSAYRIV